MSGLHSVSIIKLSARTVLMTWMVAPSNKRHPIFKILAGLALLERSFWNVPVEKRTYVHCTMITSITFHRVLQRSITHRHPHHTGSLAESRSQETVGVPSFCLGGELAQNSRTRTSSSSTTKTLTGTTAPIMVQFKQNIFLCISFSVSSALLSNSGNAFLLLQHRRQIEGTQRFPNYGRTIALLGATVCTLLKRACRFMAPWFGPVTIFVPTDTSVSLISNAVLVGAILKIEPINKNAQVAIAVLCIATVYLPIVGPFVQENPTLTELFTFQQNPMGLIWIGILGTIHFACCFIMYTTDLTKTRHPYGQNVLNGVTTTATILCGTISKVTSLAENDTHRYIFLCLYGVITFNGVMEDLQEATTVPSLAEFYSILTCVNILVNALTGVSYYIILINRICERKVKVQWSNIFSSLSFVTHQCVIPSHIFQCIKGIYLEGLSSRDILDRIRHDYLANSVGCVPVH